jgi:hypothetical protein
MRNKAAIQIHQRKNQSKNHRKLEPAAIRHASQIAELGEILSAAGMTRKALVMISKPLQTRM